MKSVLFAIALMLIVGCTTRSDKSVGTLLATQELDDMRTIYCDAAEIDSRMARQVCAVWLPGTYPGQPTEIEVTNGVHIDQVLRSFFPEQWNPQVRVISKDMIIQTSLDWRLKGHGKRGEVSVLITPGDLVFVQGVW